METRFNKLEIEQELQVSILAALVQLDDSYNSYLCQEKKNTNSVSMSMVYRAKTVSDEVFLRQLKNKIDTEVFKVKNGIYLDETIV